MKALQNLFPDFSVSMRLTRAHHSPAGAKQVLKIKDPPGGTTGRVKAIWALGVDGRSRRI
jgi:hypothetical protein